MSLNLLLQLFSVAVLLAAGPIIIFALYLNRGNL